MSFVIGILNQKGGVGKTTSAVTLGHGLANAGYRTLIVDLDPQGHVAQALGREKSPGLYNWLVVDRPLETIVQNICTNLDILPSDKTTEAAKRHLHQVYFSERILRDRLAAASYPVIILDSAPSMDILQVAALVAAQFLLIPSKLDALAIDGVNEILRSYAEIAMAGEGRSGGYAILPTFFDRVTKETLMQFDELIGAFRDHVWPPIPSDVKAREAPAFGQSLWDYAPDCPALKGYQISNGNPDGSIRRVGGYRQVLDRLIEVVDRG